MSLSGAMSSSQPNGPGLSLVPEFYRAGFKAALGTSGMQKYIHLFRLNHKFRQL